MSPRAAVLSDLPGQAGPADPAVGGLWRRGWILDGAGPARYGWAWRSPAGVETWLGRTVDLAHDRARRVLAEAAPSCVECDA